MDIRQTLHSPPHGAPGPRLAMTYVLTYGLAILLRGRISCTPSKPFSQLADQKTLHQR
jgi:hypothetical protein